MQQKEEQKKNHVGQNWRTYILAGICLLLIPAIYYFPPLIKNIVVVIFIFIALIWAAAEVGNKYFKHFLEKRIKWYVWLLSMGFLFSVCNLLLDLITVDHIKEIGWLHSVYSYFEVDLKLKSKVLIKAVLGSLTLGVPAILTIFDAISRSPEYQYTEEQQKIIENAQNVTEIFTVTNDIVYEKEESYLDLLNDNQKQYHQIFNENNRITSLLNNFIIAARTVNKDKTLKAVLVPVQKGNPMKLRSEIKHCIGSPKGSKPEGMFRKNKSLDDTFFQSALEHEKEIYQTDLTDPGTRSHEDVKFKVIKETGQNNKTNIGSMAGYRIYHDKFGQNIYVLTLKSDIPGMIDQDFIDNNAYLVQMLEARVCYEYTANKYHSERKGKV